MLKSADAMLVGKVPSIWQPSSTSLNSAFTKSPLVVKAKANKPGLFHPFIALTCSKAREAVYRIQYNASQPPWFIRFHISTERAFSVDADASSDLVLTQ